MYNAVNYMASQISQKRRYAKQVCPTEDMYKEMFEQIEICEQLGRPMTKTQIYEWSQLSVQGMLNKVHSLKFA